MRSGRIVSVANDNLGVTLGDRIAVAHTPWRRLRGLIGRRLDAGAGLVLVPCNSVHGMFMSYPIDAIYIGSDGTVLSVIRLRPWRLGPIVRGCSCVLELPAGTADTTLPGHRITFSPAVPG